jgi:hypothetical protein
VMRAAHVAARRRGFSFRDRHGGRLHQSVAAEPSGATYRLPAIRVGKTGGVGSRKAGAVSSQKPGKSRSA